MGRTPQEERVPHERANAYYAEQEAIFTEWLTAHHGFSPDEIATLDKIHDVWWHRDFDNPGEFETLGEFYFDWEKLVTDLERGPDDSFDSDDYAYYIYIRSDIASFLHTAEKVSPSLATKLVAIVRALDERFKRKTFICKRYYRPDNDWSKEEWERETTDRWWMERVPRGGSERLKRSFLEMGIDITQYEADETHDD